MRNASGHQCKEKMSGREKKWTKLCLSYKYKIGIQHFPLDKNKDYSLCIEILNAVYQLWHKSVVTVDKSSSQGLTIQNTIIKKFSHRYTNNGGSVEYMYYIRMIINFQKTWTALDPLYSLHVLVDIPQVGNDLDTYPQQLTRNWMIDYGVFGKTTSTFFSTVWGECTENCCLMCKVVRLWSPTIVYYVLLFGWTAPCY